LFWFKNAQDANMRILRWRLKLAEYDYDVVYTAGKTNVNADVLSRNPINFGKADCNVINYNTFLNPNNPRYTEIISKMLEESDEDEEDEDFELYFSDDKKFDNLSDDLEKIYSINMLIQYHLRKKNYVNHQNYKLQKEY